MKPPTSSPISIRRLAASVPLAIALALVAACRPEASQTAGPTKLEVWTAIQPPASRYQIAPEFIYALVAAESNFNARAQNGEARGLLQIKPAAWKAVSTLPYDTAAWDWRTNLEVGIDYLAYSRAYLHQKRVFSYPLLLASFHYGLDYVEDRHFDLRQIPIPPNSIYRKLWSGIQNPVPPPTLQR